MAENMKFVLLLRHGHGQWRDTHKRSDGLCDRQKEKKKKVPQKGYRSVHECTILAVLYVPPVYVRIYKYKE